MSDETRQLAALLHAAGPGPSMREGLAVLADWLAERDDLSGRALQAAMADDELQALGVEASPDGTPLARFACHALLAGSRPGTLPCATFALLPAPGLTGRVLHGPAAWPARLGAAVLVAEAPLFGQQVSELLPGLRRIWGAARRPRAVSWSAATDAAGRLGMRVVDDVEWSVALGSGLVVAAPEDLEWAAPSALDPDAGPALRAVRGPYTTRVPESARVRLARDVLPRQAAVDLGLDAVAERFCRIVQRAFVGFRGAVTPATYWHRLRASRPAVDSGTLRAAIERAFQVRIPDELFLGVLDDRLTVGGWIGELRRQL